MRTLADQPRPLSAKCLEMQLKWPHKSFTTARFVMLVCLLSTWITFLLMLAWYCLVIQGESPRSSRDPPQHPPPPPPTSSSLRDSCSREHHPKRSSTKASCSVGFVPQGGVCTPCPEGKFSLAANWIACQPLLGCDQTEVETIVSSVLLRSLGNWNHYMAEWNGYKVIYATLSTEAVTGVDPSSLQMFSSSPHFLYPIGFCKESSVALFASDLNFLKTGSPIDVAFAGRPHCNSCLVRLHMATGYVRVLSHLHASNRTLCNSNTLQHLLSQFLITDDFTLVLASLDNLPQDVNGPILCQLTELTGDFAAPEQRWPYGETKIFNSDEQPRYGRETDIWKVPDVVSSILAPCQDVMDYFSGTHSKCKNLVPRLRPSAFELLQEYESIQNLLYV